MERGLDRAHVARTDCDRWARRTGRVRLRPRAPSRTPAVTPNMGAQSVLVVGAGVAGSTLAYWLARYGMSTTVVERGQGQRSSGNPVDVRGPALAVVEQMNLLPRLRQAATLATTLSVVDGRGRRIGSIPTQARASDMEIPRSDLAAILARAGHDHAEFVYDDSVVALNDDGRGVDVTFERSAPRRFDLVAGADGLHVRRLLFGPEAQFVEHLGMYIATTTLDEPAADPQPSSCTTRRVGLSPCIPPPAAKAPRSSSATARLATPPAATHRTKSGWSQPPTDGLAGTRAAGAGPHHREPLLRLRQPSTARDLVTGADGPGRRRRELYLTVR